MTKKRETSNRAREDVRKSTTQIAKEAGISRLTAIARIENLAEEGIVDLRARNRTHLLTETLLITDCKKEPELMQCQW
jgi:DNA-binding transcriptional regulator LsrR (DeoR family)